ncbi:glycosyltransferase [Sphingobium sp. BYY-5]|uniref:glycosyltransferase n=1 Tax=Sphingobium sp. BYY-5 TaxID=2926400 RepID=UPI001FA6EFC0|nr:glycosyltransferase [Sphingobium sp. BYY-5]MCI4588666.1 glycosyltransferase [Sphingobium sp. BYY-5]
MTSLVSARSGTPDAGRAMDQAYVGHIDQIKDGVILGWIKVDGKAEPLTIDIWVDGVAVAVAATANIGRPDLITAGFGSGEYGFACSLVTDGRLTHNLGNKEEVMVEIRSHADRTILLQQPVSLRATIEQIEALQHIAAYHCSAHIDSVTDKELRGWAVNGCNKMQIFSVDILIDGALFCKVRNHQRRDDLLRDERSAGQGGIQVAMPLYLLDPGTYNIALRLPDGKIESHDIKVETGRRALRSHARVPKIHLAETAVIVPIYNAADDVKVCIERLAAFTSEDVDILFIDDASTDPRISELMKQAQAHPNMRVLRNDDGLGLTEAINKGLNSIGRKHAVMLNSDARVTPGWLEGMLTAASSRPRVATVTAMSDRAGAFSAPNMDDDNILPPGVDEIAFARAFKRRSLSIYPVAPTGNGFCMFVNRDCLDEIGILDRTFPHGSGEERDFCMRAGRAGWTHLIDDRTYVFHGRPKKSTTAKTMLMQAGRVMIDMRYPEYESAIRAFSTSADINLARMCVHLAVQDCSTARATQPRLLFVIATQAGGTPQTNLDLMNALADDFDSWLLHCDSKRLLLIRKNGNIFEEVASHELHEAVEPLRHVSSEYDEIVGEWLRRFDFELVHIRHLAWHSLNLPNIAKMHGCAVVFSFHDFYALCPSIKLLQEDGTYYGGDLDALTGEVFSDLWPKDAMPYQGANWIRHWRKRFGQALSVCDAFVTTSPSTRATILEYLPGIEPEKFHVIPHGRNFSEFSRARVRPRRGEPLRILIPGNIDIAKGLGVIQALAEADKAGLLQFHILGTTDDSQNIDHPNIIRHGRYERDDFALRVQALNIHLGAIFSIWNETYCHTLTELWSVGVPSIVLDFPTVATRIQESGAGWVLPHQDIDALYQQILAIAFDKSEQDRVDAALTAWQEGAGLGETTELMGGRYLNIYRQARGQALAPLIAVTTPTEPPLTRARISTEVRLLERSRNDFARDAIYVRMTPDALLANLRSRSIDGAILQGNVIPAAMVEPLLNACDEACIGYMIDLDDDLTGMPDDRDPDGAYKACAPHLQPLIDNAKGVTVSTASLQTRMTALDRDTHHLPNQLSTALWRGPATHRQNDGHVRALYFGNLIQTPDFGMIQPALDVIASRHPHFRMAMIGVQDNPVPAWAERIDVPADVQSYTHFVYWLRDLAKDFDFALAPLSDPALNHHQSGLEAMEAAALGLPVLVSDVPSYRAMFTGIEGISLVKNMLRDWIVALEASINSAQSVQRQGDRIKRHILNKFGINDAFRNFDDLVRNTLSISK